ncbi:MAG: DUF4199 domain-containing protein [Cyclobacteriaceae bacterium]
MLKVILKYGIIASVIIAIMMPTVAWNDTIIRSDYAALIGYTILIIAFSMIFVAVGRYSESLADGKISFGKAFLIGLGISFMATLVYVIAWGLIDGFSGGEFLDRYADNMLSELKEEGATAEEIKNMEKQMDAYRDWYATPISKMVLTSTEIFPVGVFVSLITALIFKFRKKRKI